MPNILIKLDQRISKDKKLERDKLFYFVQKNKLISFTTGFYFNPNKKLLYKWNNKQI